MRCLTTARAMARETLTTDDQRLLCVDQQGSTSTAILRGWSAAEGESGKSRAQLWRDVRNGRFPAPIELGPNSVGWFRSDIENWKASRPRRNYGAMPSAGPREGEADAPSIPSASAQIGETQPRRRGRPRKMVTEVAPMTTPAG